VTAPAYELKLNQRYGFGILQAGKFSDIRDIDDLAAMQTNLARD